MSAYDAGFAAGQDATASALRELSARYEQLLADQADLAMMMRRMIVRLRKFDGHDVIAGQAMLLLTNQHMHGSPLRGELTRGMTHE